MHFLKRISHGRAAFILTVWALGMRFHRLYYRDLWGDELYQIKGMSGAFKPFWTARYNFGDHTAFAGDYLLCYPFLQVFGINKWGLTVPHVLITILGFYWLYRICQRTYRSVWATAICFFLVAVNEELIFHHFEFRPYAVLPSLALGIYYFADLMARDYSKTRPPVRWFALFLLVFTFFYHAYGALIVLSAVSYCLLRHRAGTYRAWLLSPQARWLIVAIVIGLPIWIWFAAFNNFGAVSQNTFKFTTVTTPQAITYPFDYIAHPLIEPVRFFKHMIGNLLGYNKVAYLFLAGFLFVFFPSDRRRDQMMFLMWMIIIPLMLILIIDLTTKYWFLPRQFIWVTPWFAILLAWLWDTGIQIFSKKTPVLEK